MSSTPASSKQDVYQMAYQLYRNDRLAQLGLKDRDLESPEVKDAREKIRKQWRKEPADVRAVYEERYEREKSRREAMHPKRLPAPAQKKSRSEHLVENAPPLLPAFSPTSPAQPGAGPSMQHPVSFQQAGAVGNPQMPAQGTANGMQWEVPYHVAMAREDQAFQQAQMRYRAEQERRAYMIARTVVAAMPPPSQLSPTGALVPHPCYQGMSPPGQMSPPPPPPGYVRVPLQAQMSYHVRVTPQLRLVPAMQMSPPHMQITPSSCMPMQISPQTQMPQTGAVQLAGSPQVMQTPRAPVPQPVQYVQPAVRMGPAAVSPPNMGFSDFGVAPASASRTTFFPYPMPQQQQQQQQQQRQAQAQCASPPDVLMSGVVPSPAFQGMQPQPTAQDPRFSPAMSDEELKPLLRETRKRKAKQTSAGAPSGSKTSGDTSSQPGRASSRAKVNGKGKATPPKACDASVPSGLPAVQDVKMTGDVAGNGSHAGLGRQQPPSAGHQVPRSMAPPPAASAVARPPAPGSSAGDPITISPQEVWRSTQPAT